MNKQLATQQPNFESIKKIDDENNEYWQAREIMPLLEYEQWKNFERVIKKSIASMSKTYPHTEDHFAEVGKKIKVGSGTNKQATREIKDYKLTRRACYLIAQNGDPRKEAVAQAQSYFAQQTRRQELQETREKNIERILARRKLSETEKKFSGVLSERGIHGKRIAEIKSAGDQALFGSKTKDVKKKLGIKYTKPLADHLPTISIKAKELATEMTTHKTRVKDLSGKDIIKNEHVSNNAAVRKMLTESDIYPEELPAEEDIREIEKQIGEEEIMQLEESKLVEKETIEINICSVNDETELQMIRSTIKNNQGNSLLRIYYGEADNPKVIERDIQINSEVVRALKGYMVAR